MPRAAEILGWVFIAAGILRISFGKARMVLDRVSVRRSNLDNSAGQSRRTVAGAWRDACWAAGWIAVGIAFVTKFAGPVTWLALAVLAVISIITVPIWDPFSRARHRMRGKAGVRSGP